MTIYTVRFLALVREQYACRGKQFSYNNCYPHFSQDLAVVKIDSGGDNLTINVYKNNEFRIKYYVLPNPKVTCRGVSAKVSYTRNCKIKSFKLLFSL